MAKRVRENGDYRSMLSRMIRAYGERVAWSDDFDLAEMLTLRDELESAITTAVQGQREHFGVSWAAIAQATGTSRQAAQMRYGKTQ